MAMRQPLSPAIPVGLSKFCGRRHELGQLRRLLATDRLVTVTGTGGVGKTRLVMELAHGAGFDFPDGVWVVELARIESGALVETTIAEAVSAPHVGQAAPLERAARRLRQGRQLLILDNCEHVVEGSGNAALSLLTECPGLTVLATSREVLNVRGERVWRLLPLRLPDSGGRGQAGTDMSEAVELFCDRAQLVAPGDELPTAVAAEVAEICHRLDGLPLALELAAAWVPVLSLHQVVNRLTDSLSLLSRDEVGRPPRHRSIRAALDWSERLLTPEQARAFARLSVFVGGFSLEGADAVIRGGTDPGGSSLELIAALVSRSLIVADTAAAEARYRLLEPVRQYAAEQLKNQPAEAAETRLRHLTYLAALAEAAEEPILGGPDQPWLHRLDAELGNIRAALAWGFDQDHQVASRLASALLLYCRHRGLFGEGVGWAQQAAAHSSGRMRGRALCMAGFLSSERGDAQTSHILLDEAYQLAVAGNWQSDLVMVLVAKSVTAYVLGDLDAMRDLGNEGVQLARRLGSDAHLMWALWAPAVHASVRDEYQRALDLFSEALAIAVRLDNYSWRSALATNLIDTAVDMGDDETARRGLRSALNTFTAPDPTNASYLIEDAAILAIRGGDPHSGLRLLGAGHAFSQRTGYRETRDEAQRRRHWTDQARQDIGPAHGDTVWETGLALSVGEALDEARALVAGRLDAAEASEALPQPPSDANAFVREGEFWSLTYAGAVRRIRDSKGVRDIATLLATPRRGVAAVQLMSADRRSSNGRHAARSEADLTVEGDLGQTLDAAAMAQYRARLVDLEAEINDADEASDPERASRAREEQHFVLAELGAAVGLGGRPRRARAPAERARKAVTWRVRNAIAHVEAAHPALGAHLRRAVRTGSFCTYDPAEPTDWRL